MGSQWKFLSQLGTICHPHQQFQANGRTKLSSQRQISSKFVSIECTHQRRRRSVPPTFCCSHKVPSIQPHLDLERRGNNVPVSTYSDHLTEHHSCCVQG